MRTVAFGACLSLFATALPAQGGVKATPATVAERALRVLLLPPAPKMHEPLRYELSEPAYVAAFVIYPGAGVRLIYPTIGSPERLHRAGYNTDPLIGRSFDDDAYNVILGPRRGGAAYLYVIASRHPINVARYVHRPMKLASAVGEADARSFYASVAFDALLKNAVALGDDGSWDADVYTLWPGGASREARDGLNSPYRQVQIHYVTMLCADGSISAVPDNYPFRGCAGDTHVVLKQTLPEPPVQQTASAGAAANLTAGANSPTVLPTIIGARVSDSARRVAIARTAGAPVMYTVANGDQEPEPPVVAAAPVGQVQIIEAPFSGWRGSRPRAARVDDGKRSGVVGGAPKLPPNPRLAPNPALPPVPGMGARPARQGVPRKEGDERRATRPMRVPAVAQPARPPARTPARPAPGRDH